MLCTSQCELVRIYQYEVNVDDYMCDVCIMYYICGVVVVVTDLAPMMMVVVVESLKNYSKRHRPPERSGLYTVDI